MHHFKVIAILICTATIFNSSCYYEREVEKETDMVEKVMNDPQMREMAMRVISQNPKLTMEMLDQMFRNEHVLDLMIEEEEIGTIIQENIPEQDQEKLVAIQKTAMKLLQGNDSIVCLNVNKMKGRQEQEQDTEAPSRDTAAKNLEHHEHDH